MHSVGFPIKEVAERTGIAAGTIRMWEQRYGFPEPSRTAAGYRVYTEQDVVALRRVVAYRNRGLSVPAALERGYGDLDVVVPPKSARATTDALTSAGYQPNERFNALHGARRLLFYDTENKRQVDVFVGVFAMCHRLDLSGRLDQHPYSLDAADLLLTKLQIHEINRKDLVDAVRLLLTHDNADIGGGAGSPDTMSLDRLRSVTSADWGWFTTVTDNLALVRDAAADLL